MSGVIQAGPQTVSLLPQTAGTMINLGGVNAAGTLGLTSAELGQIAAGTLQIGTGAGGTITVSAAIALASASNVSLTSGADILFNPGSFNTDGGTLTLTPGSTGAVRPLSSGADINLGSSTLSLGSGSNLAIAINGSTVDTGYNQLSVVGGVNLGGVNLVVSGSFTPAVGESFLIVNNQGAGPISGTFNGLPEGSTFNVTTSNNLQVTLRITYHGGANNNSVVLAVVLPLATPCFTITPLGGSTLTAGSPVIATVQYVDINGTPSTNYNGTVSVSTTDPQVPTLPPVTLTNGFGFFLLTLTSAGSRTITLSDSSGVFHGTSGTITVNPASAASFLATVPANPVSGMPTNVTVTAYDPYNNVATGYAGTVKLTSTDAGAAFPVNNYTFTSGPGKDNGTHVFAVTFNTPGRQTISATDTTATNPVITATTSPVTVIGLQVTSVVGNPTGFTVTFNKPFDPATLKLYGTTTNNPGLLFYVTNANVTVPLDRLGGAQRNRHRLYLRGNGLCRPEWRLAQRRL